jgi:hypothetical protein
LISSSATPPTPVLGSDSLQRGLVTDPVTSRGGPSGRPASHRTYPRTSLREPSFEHQPRPLAYAGSIPHYLSLLPFHLFFFSSSTGCHNISALESSRPSDLNCEIDGCSVLINLSIVLRDPCHTLHHHVWASRGCGFARGTGKTTIVAHLREWPGHRMYSIIYADQMLKFCWLIICSMSIDPGLRHL